MDAGQEQGGEEQTTSTSAAKVSLEVKPLNFDQLGSMDGNTLKRMVNTELAKIGMDIYKRNDVDKPRKLTIVLEFEPVDDDGLKIDMSMQVKADFPARKAKAMRIANSPDGKMADLERPI